ncbi:MAG: helical backbone metal receptor [Mariprofundaceae bacterium]|nr:helical backbone metal receptor [Mariprofundaceae bacterium]
MRFVLLLALLLLAAPAQSAERILALSPHACEILFAIGAANEVVGAASACDYPAAVFSLPVVGNFKHVNVEAALRLRPTMAVVFDRRMGGLGRLQSMGVKVVETHPRTVQQVVHDIRRLGRLTGHAESARRLADDFDSRLKKLHQQVTASIKVFFEAWSRPLVSSGASSFITDVLRVSGARNVFGHVSAESPRVSVEAVIRARPAAILVPDMPGHVKVRRHFWRQYFGDRVPVIPVPQDLISRPGPRLIDGIEILSVRLHEAVDDS